VSVRTELLSSWPDGAECCWIRTANKLNTWYGTAGHISFVRLYPPEKIQKLKVPAAEMFPSLVNRSFGLLLNTHGK